MRVVIDTQATAGQSTGFGRYVLNLVKALRDIAPTDVEVVEISRVKHNLRTPTRILWDQLGLPLVATFKRPDILFTPAFSTPIFWPGKHVATCHDLIGRLFPSTFSRSARFYWSNLLPRSMRHADHILTISETTKRDIVRLLGIPDNRITVTPLGVESAFRPEKNPEEISQIRRRYNLPRAYCLAVGTIEPRKNYPFLVDVFAVAKRQDHDLVIVGKRGWDAAAVEQRVRQLHLADRVRILEYVSEPDLVTLLSNATALLFPSRYEGFGLPVLEAMACGTPVVASTTSSVPEVGGEAVLYADPADRALWIDHISRIIADPKLREDLSTRGLARAATFTWQRTAQLTLEALYRVYHA